MQHVAHNVVSGLKSQPLALALVVINVLFLAFATFMAYRVNNDTVAEREFLNRIVSECVLGKDESRHAK